MAEELQALQKVLTECVQALPVQISIEMRNDALVFDGWIHIGFGDHDGACVYPEYIIILEKHYPSNQDEPESTELEELCTMSNLYSVVEKVLDIALHNMVSCTLQNMGEQKAFEDANSMYEEWAAESNGEI